MADFWRDLWIRETGTGQQVAQLQDKYDDDDDDDDDDEIRCKELKQQNESFISGHPVYILVWEWVQQYVHSAI